MCISFLSLPALRHTESFEKNTGKLPEEVIGFESENGECWFAIHNFAAIYESEDTFWIGKILPIKNNKIIVETDALKFGVFAVRVYHDENKNSELDTNFPGIPRKDYCILIMLAHDLDHQVGIEQSFCLIKKKCCLKLTLINHLIHF